MEVGRIYFRKEDAMSVLCIDVFQNGRVLVAAEEAGHPNLVIKIDTEDNYSPCDDKNGDFYMNKLAEQFEYDLIREQISTMKVDDACCCIVGTLNESCKETEG